MKLVMAIVQAVDARALMDALMAAGYRATKIGSTGGFLVRGNVTVLVGIENDKVDAVLDILRKHCHSRREFVSPPFRPLSGGPSPSRRSSCRSGSPSGWCGGTCPS